ncbi:MAG: 30S ribosomal protein S13 [Candidatus Cloacimonas sp. 4484_209]|nr:MAG: 30S ribosomal protein S13 [Candidatus Cloacimonas sp. 4484_209]
MARIAGIDLPKNKRIEIALTYIFGIGRTSSTHILSRTNIDPGKKVKDLTEKEIESIRKEIENNYMVEGVLRAEISNNIKRLIEIGSYRGIRHKKGLPVRGQRTRTNARTRKGPKKGSVALRKKSRAKK